MAGVAWTTQIICTAKLQELAPTRGVQHTDIATLWSGFTLTAPLGAQVNKPEEPRTGARLRNLEVWIPAVVVAHVFQPLVKGAAQHASIYPSAHDFKQHRCSQLRAAKLILVSLHHQVCNQSAALLKRKGDFTPCGNGNYVSTADLDSTSQNLSRRAA